MPSWRTLTVTVVAAMMALFVVVPSAEAHAELRQASPGIGETVGGSFHAVIMAFTDLDVNAPQSAQLFDPAGNEIDSELVVDGQRLILPIEPLEIPGQYLVQFSVNGIDGDFIEDQKFTFIFDPSAPEPSPITFGIAEPEGFDFVTFTLLTVLAGLLAFLVHRVLSAWRQHKAAGLAASEL